MRINVQGTLWGIQAAAKKFIERQQKGKIINACSIAGHNGFALLGIYSATKFAMRALTQTMSPGSQFSSMAVSFTVKSYKFKPLSGKRLKTSLILCRYSHYYPDRHIKPQTICQMRDDTENTRSFWTGCFGCSYTKTE